MLRQGSIVGSRIDLSKVRGSILGEVLVGCGREAQIREAVRRRDDSMPSAQSLARSAIAVSALASPLDDERWRWRAVEVLFPSERVLSQVRERSGGPPDQVAVKLVVIAQTLVVHATAARRAASSDGGAVTQESEFITFSSRLRISIAIGASSSLSIACIELTGSA